MAWAVTTPTVRRNLRSGKTEEIFYDRSWPKPGRISSSSLTRLTLETTTFCWTIEEISPKLNIWICQGSKLICQTQPDRSPWPKMPFKTTYFIFRIFKIYIISFSISNQSWLLCWDINLHNYKSTLGAHAQNSVVVICTSFLLVSSWCQVWDFFFFFLPFFLPDNDKRCLYFLN